MTGDDDTVGTDGPLQRVPDSPLGVRTDGRRLEVTGSSPIWVMLVAVAGVLLGAAASGNLALPGLIFGVLLLLGLLWANRRARTVLDTDGRVLVTGEQGRHWVDTTAGARIFFFSQYLGYGTMMGVGIDRGAPGDKPGLVGGGVARIDKLGSLATFFGGGRAIRILAAANRAGVWPRGCWVDLSRAPSSPDPRVRHARASLEEAGLTHPPA